MKHSCLNFFYEIVNKISIKVKRNWNLKNSPRLKDDQFIVNPDFQKILKEYSVILTTPFYGMNQKYKQQKLNSKISVDSDFMFSSYAWVCVF